MRAWITGGGGFMGHHLTEFLANKGYQVLSTYCNPTTDIRKLDKRVKKEECDVRDKEKINLIMREFKPDKIFHLAAQSYPSVSWEYPLYTIEVNVNGTINIFEAVKKYCPECRILNACSSAEYGFVKPEEVPVKESHALNPLHPYGVSKIAQEKLAYQYFQNFGIKSVSLRIFNTTGPFKVNDVCSDLTKRLVEIEKKGRGMLRVGNLETRRAITDVRDLIRGFDLALDYGEMGETYNVSGERVYQISEIVNYLKKLVDFQFELYQDPKLMRPTDEPIIYGDSSRFKERTGWKQEIRLEETLKDMMSYWRGVL